MIMKNLAGYLKKLEIDSEKFSKLFKKGLEVIMKNLARYLKKLGNDYEKFNMLFKKA